MSEPVYIIGIDLGTTNSVVAYTQANVQPGENPEIKLLEIPQLVSSGTVEKREVLPSFVFIPGKHDIAADGLTLPWEDNQDLAVGEFARDRGAELPQRLISSSKSWLCNTMVDRNKPILPWECPDKSSKKSPVEASSAILSHIRNAWNYEIATTENGVENSLLMENQDILLTVPASFDAVARDLTVKAAEMAGLKNITLLEEPQAAFYAWIEQEGDQWRKLVGKDDLVLVCDIGGGTTDFSLSAFRKMRENWHLNVLPSEIIFWWVEIIWIWLWPMQWPGKCLKKEQNLIHGRCEDCGTVAEQLRNSFFLSRIEQTIR
jgi:molecular chaperone DnaK (HSP70)